MIIIIMMVVGVNIVGDNLSAYIIICKYTYSYLATEAVPLCLIE